MWYVMAQTSLDQQRRKVETAIARDAVESDIRARVMNGNLVAPSGIKESVDVANKQFAIVTTARDMGVIPADTTLPTDAQKLQQTFQKVETALEKRIESIPLADQVKIKQVTDKVHREAQAHAAIPKAQHFANLRENLSTTPLDAATKQQRIEQLNFLEQASKDRPSVTPRTVGEVNAKAMLAESMGATNSIQKPPAPPATSAYRHDRHQGEHEWVEGIAAKSKPATIAVPKSQRGAVNVAAISESFSGTSQTSSTQKTTTPSPAMSPVKGFITGSSVAAIANVGVQATMIAAQSLQDGKMPEVIPAAKSLGMAAANALPGVNVLTAPNASEQRVRTEVAAYTTAGAIVGSVTATPGLGTAIGAALTNIASDELVRIRERGINGNTDVAYGPITQGVLSAPEAAREAAALIKKGFEKITGGDDIAHGTAVQAQSAKAPSTSAKSNER